MENNIKIINYSYEKINYGAVLTAFALQELFNSLKISNILINNTTPYHESVYFGYQTFNSFKKKYFNLSMLAHNYEQFFYFNKNTNIFITGSDQVFRPKISGEERLYQYFLDFVEPQNKKIAFSASFGVDKETYLNENSDEILDRIKQSLQSFDLISVREKSGIKICKDVFNVDAEWIIDPVFILDKFYWESLSTKSNQNFTGQIVSYILDPDKNKKLIEEYQNDNNCKVFDLFKSNATIEDWLNAINNSKLFITDSFHGMCFAIIFNKPFVGILNSNSGSARYNSLFEMLGIDNALITSDIKKINNDSIFNINYEKVNALIGKERQKGLKFIKKILEIKTTKQEEKKAIYNRCVKEMKVEQRNIKKRVKNFVWICWLFIFHNILPEPLKTIIRKLRNMTKCK